MIKKANIPAVLMLIFGMSSMASGLILVVGDGTTFTDPGDEVSIDIGDTIWIGIHDSFGEMYQATILSYRRFDSGEWTGNSTVYSPPAISTAPGWKHFIYDDKEDWVVDLTDSDSTETPMPGVGCAIEFRALSVGFFVIDLNLSPLGPEDFLWFNIVPEPTTFLLLTLGTLFLTKRTKDK
ncbi:MAG: PEP-CTERM sorting domain-containing protein [Planctomycetota bacterium]